MRSQRRLRGAGTISREDHPSVQRYRARSSALALAPLEAEELRRICFESGADDVGFLSIDDPEIAAQKPDIIKLFPDTRTVVSLLCRMNRVRLGHLVISRLPSR